ncbi:type I-E CRISPR-associated protein Cse1/CasA [Williamsia sp. CHRR-6]|uniref:type I-E CRISPR-associated protein Cse1/CasA n=1 Tax=Williamsia sp. CHRR-6 TaxID=2835871 RepID=UPI001BDA548F|nr:type I-E CRISPR-associated protein Cse1/CasA [Williamsia sp. CHRR-6]MBT0566995.1 type I-E CRISPR-associated protein Cse1/CasA [Williamsia sp. CHRR-6]
MTTFNLIDEPWIIVFARDGSIAERSIRDVLLGADEVASIGGDIPTQQFAIARLLLAIVRRAVDWTPDPLQRWSELWTDGALPHNEINAYLDRVHDRFDICDPKRPFYQVADFHTAKGEVKPVTLVVSDVPAGYPYFTTRAGSGAARLPLAEAARWIVHTQAYDTSGIKTGDPRDPRTKGGKGYPIGIAWCGQLGGILAETTDLARTLLLNTPLRTSTTPLTIEGDSPCWERDHLGIWPRDNVTPSGPIDLLTWQSRRIKVVFDEDQAVGVLVGNGDPLEPFAQLGIEHLSGWRFSDQQSKKRGGDTYYPRTFDADRSVWEGFENLLLQTSEDGNRGKCAALFDWLDLLVDKRVLNTSFVVTPHIFGLRYDTQSSIIGASIDDRIAMRVANFGSDGCRRVAVEAAAAAGRVARVIGQLAKNLAQAAGGVGDTDEKAARMQFLSRLDVSYRAWLLDLGVGDVDEHLIAWHRMLHRSALADGALLVMSAGRPAFVGRVVTSSSRKPLWLDAARSELFFRTALNREVPGAFIEDKEKTDAR